MGFIGPNFNQQPYRPQQAGNGGMPIQQSGMMPAGSGACGPRMPSLESLLAPLLMAQMALSPEQTAMLLKNLLKMPKEMVQLLAMLANLPQAGEGLQQHQQQLLQTLLAENPQLMLEDLQQFLQGKTKEGSNKLLSMLQHQQASMAGQGGKELSDLLKQITQMSTRVQASPTEALTQTLLLYLPWYPLESPVKMQLYFEAAGGEDDEDGAHDEEYNLILLLETLTLGKFKVVVGVRDKILLLFKIEHDAIAQPYIRDLHGALLGELTGESLPPPLIEWEPRETPSLLGGDAARGSGVSSGEPKKQSLGIHPVGGASVLVVNAAYVTARVILETDRRNSLLQ